MFFLRKRARTHTKKKNARVRARYGYSLHYAKRKLKFVRAHSAHTYNQFRSIRESTRESTQLIVAIKHNLI